MGAGTPRDNGTERSDASDSGAILEVTDRVPAPKCCTPLAMPGPSGTRVRHAWSCKKRRGQPVDDRVRAAFRHPSGRPRLSLVCPHGQDRLTCEGCTRTGENDWEQREGA